MVVSSGREVAENKVTIGLDVHKFMNDLVHHNCSELFAPIFQGVPPKSVKHLGNTVIIAVFVHDESGCSPLDHFDGVNA